MFKNNSYSMEACNYSFREDQHDKQNQNSLNNYIKKDSITAKLEAIQKLMNRQYQAQMENRKILQQQSQKITKLQKQVIKISKIIRESALNSERCSNSRMKSQSLKSCRTKRSTQKSVLNCIQQRKKVINEQLSRRINDQLDSKQEKKPLRFFFPTDQSIL